MPSMVAPGGFGAGHELADTELQDARSSLAYWQARSRRLPRRAVRKRREAREMAARWESRVAEAERAAYGRGLAGMLMLILAEGRLPQRARGAGRRLARRSAQVAMAVVTFALVLAVVGTLLLIELLSSLVATVA
jgi:hypothetical protein